MLDLEDITEHYPETLRRWRENFVGSAERVAELGYDLRFRRLWELYFAWCEGGFRERRIGDVQAPVRQAVIPRLTARPAADAGPRPDLKPGALHYVRRGRGEPLVLIHPLGAELVVWEPVMERLARERDVIAVDLPGFGALAGAGRGADAAQLAGAVAGLLDELGIERAARGRQLAGRLGGARGGQGRPGAVGGRRCAPPGCGRSRSGRGADATSRAVGRRLLPVMPTLLRSAAGPPAGAASVGGAPGAGAARGGDAAGARVRDRGGLRERERGHASGGVLRLRGRARAGDAGLGRPRPARAPPERDRAGRGARSCCTAAATSPPGTTRARWPGLCCWQAHSWLASQAVACAPWAWPRLQPYRPA